MDPRWVLRSIFGHRSCLRLAACMGTPCLALAALVLAAALSSSVVWSCLGRLGMLGLVLSRCVGLCPGMPSLPCTRALARGRVALCCLRGCGWAPRYCRDLPQALWLGSGFAAASPRALWCCCGPCWPWRRAVGETWWAWEHGPVVSLLIGELCWILHRKL